MSHTPPTRLTTTQLDALLASIRSLPDTVVGEHLTDEKVFAYCQESLDVREVRQIDEHLETCPECTERVDACFEANRFLQSPDGQAWMTNLTDRLRTAITMAAIELGISSDRLGPSDAWGCLTEQLRVGFAALFGGQLPLAASDSPKPLVEVTTADGQTTIRVYRKLDGDLNVVVVSQDVNLAGRRFAIRFAKLQPPPVTLEKLDNGLLFGKVVVPSELAPDEFAGLTVGLEPVQ